MTEQLPPRATVIHPPHRQPPRGPFSVWGTHPPQRGTAPARAAECRGTPSVSPARGGRGTVGPGSSFRRTPVSAQRGRVPRFTTPPSTPPVPSYTEAAEMPWFTVHGREPTRMERWAAFLLPPREMGPELSTVAGDATSRLRVLDAHTFEVISTVVTRYHRLRGQQARRPDQVSEISISLWFCMKREGIGTIEDMPGRETGGSN